MKKSILITGIATLSFLFIWCSIESYFNYRNTQKELSDRSESFFRQAIEEDKKLMSHRYSILEKINTRISDSIVIEAESGRRVFRKPLNVKKISLAENQRWRGQHLITTVSPNHAFELDSVFRSLLPAPLQTAVWCITLDRDTFRSPADNHFYKKAIALKPVVFEWNSMPETRIELRAFVEYPFSYIMKRMPNTGMFSVIWLVLIGGIIYSFMLYKKIKESVPEELEVPEVPVVVPEELKEVEKPEVIIEEYAPAKMEYIQFTDTLLYNKTLAQLAFGEKIIQLTGNPLRLFTAFLDSPEHSLSYLFISVGVLGRSTNEKKVVDEITNKEHIIQYLDSSDKNAIYQVINSLRLKLKGLPLSIDKIGEHYQLIISTDIPNTDVSSC